MGKLKRLDRRTWTRVILVLVLVVIPTAAAIGSHRFIDVPTNHVFHDDISWLADQGNTRGCNPPANTQFCPDDPVTRGQMAAFMKRFSDTVSAPGGGGPSTRISQSGVGNTLIPDDVWTTLATTQFTAPTSGGAIFVDGTASLAVEAVTDGGAIGLVVATVNQSCSSNASGPAVLWSTASLTGLDSVAVSGVMGASGGTQTVRLCAIGLHTASGERTDALGTISAIWFPSSQVALQDGTPDWPSVEETVAKLRERSEALR